MTNPARVDVTKVAIVNNGTELDVHCRELSPLGNGPIVTLRGLVDTCGYAASIPGELEFRATTGYRRGSAEADRSWVWTPSHKFTADS